MGILRMLRAGCEKVWKGWVQTGISVPSVQFCCEPKPALKNKVHSDRQTFHSSSLQDRGGLFFSLFDSGLGWGSCFGPWGPRYVKKQRLGKHVLPGACPPHCRNPRDPRVERPGLASGRVSGPALPAEVPMTWDHPRPPSPRSSPGPEGHPARPLQGNTAGLRHHALQWFVTCQKVADSSRDPKSTNFKGKKNWWI